MVHRLIFSLVWSVNVVDFCALDVFRSFRYKTSCKMKSSVRFVPCWRPRTGKSNGRKAVDFGHEDQGGAGRR